MFFQWVFPPNAIVITAEVLALRAFQVQAAGAGTPGELRSANICSQQLTSRWYRPARADNEALRFCAQHLTLRAKEDPSAHGTSQAHVLPTAVGFV